MKKLIYLLGFSVAVLTSCSSSDDSSTTNEDDVLVKRTIRTYASDGAVVTVNHTYNGKKAVRSENSAGYYETYTYTGDLITQIKNYDQNDVLLQTETFTYNSNNQLITYVRAEIQDNIGSKEVYEYNNDGTVSVSSYSGSATSQTTLSDTGIIAISGGEVVFTQMQMGYRHTYTYDTKNNPFKNITGFDKIMFIEGESTGGMQHNILTDTRIGLDTYVTTSVYTYNVMNFPISVVETEDNDTSSAITIQFFYN